MIMAAAFGLAGFACSPIHTLGFSIPYSRDRTPLTPITEKKRQTFKPGKNRPKHIQRRKK